MQKLGFVLNRNGLEKSAKEKKRYYRRDLELMTVLELREIARRENIISGIINPLQKDLLIDTILRYRGADAALLIKEYREEDYEVLTEAVLRASFRKKEEVSVEASARITLYQGLAADYYDEITTSFVPEFIDTNAFLIDSEQNLCAVFNVKARPGDTSRLYLIKSAALPAREAPIKRYFLIFFERQYSDDFYRFYNGEITRLSKSIPAVFEELLDFNVKTPDVLKMPAAIDFGSVNTVAGVLDTREIRGETPKFFDDDTIYACFYDQHSRATNVVPSIVGVVSLENPEKPKYCFGYDAIEESLNHIDEGFCIFYDMKRWVADSEKEEELTDIQGRRVFVKRKDILREFFLYVIHSLENRIKCHIKSLHLPSPVKQKEKFQRLFREILPEYVIEQRDMIDEGVSVLYNTISEMIESKTVPDNKKLSALIIDCGGGTIDISSCSFKVEDKRVAYKIDIETGYENGSTDFGGNNLTMRILQFLKLRLVEAMYRDYLERLNDNSYQARRSFYGEKSAFDEYDREVAETIPPLSSLMRNFDREIFRYVDKNGAESIYKDFEEAYAIAETILPTKFKNWEKKNRDEYFWVRNNFYFLFQCAEQIKKVFYEDGFVLKAQLSSENAKLDFKNAHERDFDGAVKIPINKWKLRVQNRNGLYILTEMPEISFSKFEINLLLTPDIYGAVHRFMNPLYESGELDEYNIIRLSGQSCKIGIFRSSLNEFVPGKIIKSRRETDLKNKNKNNNVSELKMNCIEGVLKYIRDKKFGYADVTITNKRPNIPYTLTGFTHTGAEIAMIDGPRNRTHGVLSRNMDDLTLNLYLKDEEGKLRHEFLHYSSLDEFTVKRQEEIEELYGEHIPQDDTDNIVDREVKFFIWSVPSDWGFMVVPVYRSGETLHLGKEAFYSYENDDWVNSFFDGTN